MIEIIIEIENLARLIFVTPGIRQLEDFRTIAIDRLKTGQDGKMIAPATALAFELEAGGSAPFVHIQAGKPQDFERTVDIANPSIVVETRGDEHIHQSPLAPPPDLRETFVDRQFEPKIV
ncbi:hypothetical protein H5P30_20365 [Puniceicoccus vermicola]|uniref:Uncharacterized protein n=1 Tax=Puniceicoccus vermicola TaxID=388746 RepID=A0A7X1E5Y9_9BACT|nr:hypothetical protein [Puniceicoccus vermicola]MBC2604145.1 hypothetical protein [Puniceicoccus vermicola]